MVIFYFILTTAFIRSLLATTMITAVLRSIRFCYLFNSHFADMSNLGNSKSINGHHKNEDYGKNFPDGNHAAD
jgi:hypothetical protein